MIRCRCGTWTDYGMTCVACRSETYKNMRPPSTVGGDDDSVEIEDDLQDEDSEDDD